MGPVWSPDGKQIAFYDNNRHIIAVPAGGGRAKTLVTGAMIPADWQALRKPPTENQRGRHDEIEHAG
jgi:hypothetical protein